MSFSENWFLQPALFCAGPGTILELNVFLRYTACFEQVNVKPVGAKHNGPDPINKGTFSGRADVTNLTKMRL